MNKARECQQGKHTNDMLVYILDDALWAADANGEYRAITMEDMVLRATK